jgi:acetyl esterase/lipase
MAPGDAIWTAERRGDPDSPVLAVFIHGGFWRAQYAADTIAPLAIRCAQAGYRSWNVEYPRVGMAGGGWPGTADAVRSAVLGAVAAADGRPLLVVGHSAGGHLALWVAGEVAVSEVVSLAGVCDMSPAASPGMGNGAVAEFLGTSTPDAALLAAASPIARLPIGVPALLIHGDADDRVPIAQSRAYLAAARAAGDRCELAELPGVDHFALIDPDGPAWPLIEARLAARAAARQQV